LKLRLHLTPDFANASSFLINAQKDQNWET
jgi:hypothetical protein